MTKHRALNLFISFLILALCPLFGQEQSTPKEEGMTHQQMVEALNKEIEDLDDERDKYTAKAARYQDKGDRLQFRPGNLAEARYFWNRADTANEIAKKIDIEIKKLEGERDELVGKKKGSKT